LGNERSFVKDYAMAISDPTSDKAKGTVRKRTQLRSKVMGERSWTKRDKNSGQFMDQKKAPAKKKHKGVRREGRRLTSLGGRYSYERCVRMA
jgi:hypothetical protein